MNLRRLRRCRGARSTRDMGHSVAVATSTAPRGIDLAWEVARDKLAVQHDLFKALDNKAQAMIVLLTAALGGYLVAAKAVYERVAGGVGLVVAIALVAAAYATSRFADAPGVGVFVAYAGYPPSEMKRYFIEAVLDAIRANQRQLRRRARLLNSGFVIVALLALAVVVLRASGVERQGL